MNKDIEIQKNAQEKLVTNMTGFYNVFPLYYYLLAPIDKKPLKSIQTMSVSCPKRADGYYDITLNYNPQFVLGLSNSQLCVVLHHESLHLSLKHLVRIGNRDKMLANMAADVVVNSAIPNLKGRVGDEMYNQLCVADKFPSLKGVNLREETFETVYEKLKDDPKAKEMSQQMKFEHIWGDSSDGDNGESDSNSADANVQKEALFDAAIRQAVKDLEGKDAGDIPGELQRIIEELTVVKFNWKKYISIFAQRLAQEDKSNTWKRLNRRNPYLTPGHKKEYKPSLLVAVDNSGSTCNVYDEFMAHICLISKTIDIDVIGCDTRVNFEYSFANGKMPTNFSDKMSGGGTMFQPVFDYAKGKAKYDGIIYLTDGDNFDKCINNFKIPTLFAICEGGHEVKGYKNISVKPL